MYIAFEVLVLYTLYNDASMVHGYSALCLHNVGLKAGDKETDRLVTSLKEERTGPRDGPPSPLVWMTRIPEAPPVWMSWIPAALSFPAT